MRQSVLIGSISLLLAIASQFILPSGAVQAYDRVPPGSEPRDVPMPAAANALAPNLPVLAPPVGDPSDWVLTFSDEFTGTDLNRAQWATNYGFDTECRVPNPPPGTAYCDRSNNDEKEWYVDDAHQVENGTLKLIASKNDCTGDDLPDRSYAPYTCENFPILSGMISTRRGFSQLYGYFEARMKMPAGQGFWPAFWLMPQLPPLSSPAEVYWPPEIDIIEYKGQEVQNAYMTYFWSGVYPDPGSALNNWSVGGYNAQKFSGPDFSAGFHTFAVYWSPDVLIWYIDGIERNRRTQNLPPGNVKTARFSR